MAVISPDSYQLDEGVALFQTLLLVKAEGIVEINTSLERSVLD